MMVLQTLESTYSLLQDKTKWCQGTAARDKNGNKVWSESPEAVSWCVYGAMALFSSSNWWKAAAALAKVVELPAAANDKLNGYEVIMKGLKESIKLEKDKI